ncbi:MAG TPA: TonB-dependent receptor, partial [Bryobacteraceae bacterium]
MLRCSVSVMIALLAAGVAYPQVTFNGKVVDDDGAPLAHARISLHQGAETPRTVETGPTGAFKIDLPQPGKYLVTVQRTGYFQLSERPIVVDHAGHDVTLVLNPNREIFQSVDVGESSSPVDPAQTEREQRLSGTEVNDIPYPATQSFRNSLKLIPGVIEDPAAGLHFHGGAEYQTQYTLDGFDVTDPVTGRFNTTLAVEGIRSVDVLTSRETPQYGRGSAGTMAVRIENGTDEYRFTATNFIPGFDTRGGFSLGAWSPRAVFSGPIKKGRAWFSDSITGGYSSGYVSGLPRGQNTNSSWSAGNLFHSQINLTQSNILFADFLSNFTTQAHTGLGPLDPVATTTSQHSNEFLGAVKDTHAWRSGAYVEFGIAFHRVFHEATPQGPELYIISPQGRSGNYFVRSRQQGARDQVFANFFPPVIHWWGRHQLQTGVDYQRLGYTGRFQRTGYQIIGLNGLPEYTTTFTGDGNFHLPNSAEATYFNDHWTVIKSLAIDAGVRQDFDQLTGDAVVAPRAAVAWSPFENLHTKVLAGYSVIYDATNLATFAAPYDQQAVTTPYSAAGIPGTPYTTTFLPGHNLRLPRYSQFSGGLEHDFGHGIYATADYLRKRGSDGFVYAPQNGSAPI